MLLRPNPSSGVPIYLKLMEQVKHSNETGALRPGEQLPGIRPLAELVIGRIPWPRPTRMGRASSNCAMGPGVRSANGRAQKATDKLRAGQTLVAAAVERLRARGVTDEEIRRLFEAALAGLDRTGGQGE